MDDKDTESNSQPPQKYEKRYGKHTVWWWIVIYLIVAIVVYGIIYLLFFRGTGNSIIPVY